MSGRSIRRNSNMRKSAEMVLWYNKAMNVRMRCGQAMLEYVLSFASLLVVVGVLWGLVRAAIRHAERTETLVASDCP